MSRRDTRLVEAEPRDRRQIVQQLPCEPGTERHRVTHAVAQAGARKSQERPDVPRVADDRAGQRLVFLLPIVDAHMRAERARPSDHPRGRVAVRAKPAKTTRESRHIRRIANREVARRHAVPLGAVVGVKHDVEKIDRLVDAVRQRLERARQASQRQDRARVNCRGRAAAPPAADAHDRRPAAPRRSCRRRRRRRTRRRRGAQRRSFRLRRRDRSR